MVSADLIAAPARIIKLNASQEGMDMFMPELRFDQNWTVQKCKEFLERKFGTNPADMRLQLKNRQGEVVGQMTDPAKTLGEFEPCEGFTVHVIDESGHSVTDEFSDVSKVQKYEISEEDYSKRDDSVRTFKQRMAAAGHKGFQNNQGDSVYEDFMKEESEVIQVESRCKTSVGERLGCVKYVGKVPGLGAGFWIGVLLDEPTGDSNGKHKNKTYFEAGDKCAMFVRPTDLTVGDFREKDPFVEEDDEI